MSKDVGHGLHDGREDGVGLRREPVVHPEPLTAGGDETSPAQIGQVSRHLRLRLTEALVKAADAHFAREQQPEDPQPCSISERVEDPLQ